MCVDHVYIDANLVAERYLHHSLGPTEMREFEEHIVDCFECSDRLLLAQMFEARKKAEPKPMARIVLLKPKPLALTIAGAAAVIPILYLLVRLIQP